MIYAPIPSFAKDQAANLDFAWDWSSWLAQGESITSQSVTADAGLTVSNVSLSGQQVIAWLSGGASGQSYNVKCQISTSAGRTDARSISLEIRNR